MFKEGTNIKGLIIFVIIIIAIFVYLAWQSGAVITKEKSLIIDPVKNYQVELRYDSAIYNLWRYNDSLKFQQNEQIQFYYDLSTDSLRVYNQDRLVAPNSNFKDFIIKYDPYQVINVMKSSLSYEKNDKANYYVTEMYDNKVSIYLNEYDLPDSIIFDNSDLKVQYMYLKVGNIFIDEVLPQVKENEN